MVTGQDHDLRAENLEEQAVRKPPNGGPPRCAVRDRKEERRLSKELDHPRNLAFKVLPQPGALIVVPLAGRLGPRPALVAET